MIFKEFCEFGDVKRMNKNKQLIVNMVASILTYLVTLGINFFLSPYIVENVGADAYGFIGLANNFISYASLISIAINSMASRFITIKIHQNDMNGANKYFSSVFFANTIITALLFVVFSIIFIFLEDILNIPVNIFWDVKILFALLFVNCLLNQMGSVFGVATFATNKLYLSSLRSVESQIIRILAIVVLFILFAPKISYLGLGTLICTVYVIIHNFRYQRKLLPQIYVKRKYFDFQAIRELMSAGVWNLVMRLGQILQDGLDLLITNIFVDPFSMGVLSLAKIIPSAISGITGHMVTTFSPNFTKLYAEGKKEELVLNVKQSIKFMGVLVNIPIIVLLVCGELFFELWQPTQDSQQLHLLSILTCAGLIVVGGINCIYNIFTIVNKVKLNSLLICFTGVLNVVAVFIILNTTNMGIFAVAGISSIIATIRNLLFTIPYGAYCLEQKWYTFYPGVMRSVIFVVVTTIIGYILKEWMMFKGWAGLIIMAMIMVVVSLFIGLAVVLNKEDRRYLMLKFRSRKGS